MKESKAVSVTKEDIKRNLYRREYQLYANNVISRFEKSFRGYDVGIQCDSKRDNLICTCRKPSTWKKRENRFFSPSPKQIFTYHRSRSFTEIGVGSVKKLQKRRVKRVYLPEAEDWLSVNRVYSPLAYDKFRVYLPETRDRGVGSEDLSLFIRKKSTIEKSKQQRNSYYEQKKTSSKCVGGTIEVTIRHMISAKISPICNTRSGSTTPSNPYGITAKHAEIGSETVQKQMTNATTHMEYNATATSNKTSIESKEVNMAKQSVQSEVKPTTSAKKEKVNRDSNMKDDKSFSSVSLEERVHNLDNPSEYKVSVDVMENKLEREYRKMFVSKSKDEKSEIKDEKAMPEKSTSLFKRRFTALRRTLGKKDSKNALTMKASSQASVASVRDVSITSDPPSLESRSFSNTAALNVQEQTVVKALHPKASYKKSSYAKTKCGMTQDSSGSRANVIDSEYATGVKGMFKLWGKKFNLDESTHKNEDITDSSEIKKGNIKESLEIKKDSEFKTKEKEDKRENKRFFFFKKKKSKDTKDTKDTKEQTFKKKGVTTGRCEVRDGLTIKIGASPSPRTPPPNTKKKSTPEMIPGSYNEMFRAAWLMKFLTTPIESRNSVKIRWNNNTYTTSSSTVFELMEHVYKDTGVVLRSKSEIATDNSSSFYNSYSKSNNIFAQNLETWMMPATVLDDQPLLNVKELSQNEATDQEISDETIDENENMSVTISDQKWFIDKSKAFANTIEVVLRSNNILQLNNCDSSSEYMKIDIPKGFFSDDSDKTSSDENTPPIQILTSEEQVYNVVEYDNAKLSIDMLNERDDVKVPEDIRNSTPRDIKVTISVKNSFYENTKILEKVIKRPPMHRDVVLQGSDVIIPKRCDVIGVGIITHRDVRDANQSVLRIVEYETEEDSSHSLAKRKACNFAESYLQEYYRHLQPLGMDLFSWCASDSHVKCCSSHSQDSKDGIGSKSCPNIYDDYITFESYSSSLSQIQSYAVKEVKDKDKKQKGKGKNKDDYDMPDSLYRVLPKDSLEVFKKRKIYAKGKMKWQQDCPQISSPSNEDCGVQNFGSKKSCQPKAKKCPPKRVNLPDCAAIDELKQNMSNAPVIPPGILVFGGAKKVPSASGKCKTLQMNDNPCDIPVLIPPCQKTSTDSMSPCTPFTCCRKPCLTEPVDTNCVKKGKEKCESNCVTPPCKKLSQEFPWPTKTQCSNQVSVNSSIQSVYNMQSGFRSCDCPQGRPYDNCSQQCPNRTKSAPSCGSHRESPKGGTMYGAVPNTTHVPLELIKNTGCNDRSACKRSNHQSPTNSCQPSPKTSSPKVCCKQKSSPSDECKCPPKPKPCPRSPPKCPSPPRRQCVPQKATPPSPPKRRPAECPPSPRCPHEIPCPKTTSPPCSKKTSPPCSKKTSPPCSKKTSPPCSKKTSPQNPPKPCPPKPPPTPCPPKPCLVDSSTGTTKKDAECGTPNFIGDYVIPPKPCPKKRLDCPKTCPTKSLITGIHLKKNPNLKANCSSEFLKQQCHDEIIRLNSTEKITFKLRDNCSTNDIRIGDIKIRDFDGQTIIERKDYTGNNNYNVMKSVPSERATPFLESIYKDSVPITVNEMASIERTKEVKSKSDASIANVIEINFRLRVNQGDKTTEINVGSDEIEKRKIDKNPHKEVYVVKNEKSTQEIKDNNDVNIRIFIKNFKIKSDTKKKAVEDFSKKISKKFNTVSTGYSTDIKDVPEVVSIHRATIDLTTSVESKIVLDGIDKNLEQKSKSQSVQKIPIEIFPVEEVNNDAITDDCKNIYENSNFKQDIEESLSSKHVVNSTVAIIGKSEEIAASRIEINESNFKKNTESTSNQQEIINNTVSFKEEVIEIESSERKPELLERHCSELISAVNTESKTNDTIETNVNKTSNMNLNIDRLYKSEARLSMTDTEDISLGNKTSDEPTDAGNKTSDERTCTDYGKTSEEADSDTKTSDILVVEKIPSDDSMLDLKKSKKDEKKEMLKQVFENSNYLKKPKTRNRMQKLKDILKSILTSESEPDVGKNSSEVFKSVTHIYDSIEPVSSLRSLFKPLYPTTDNSNSEKETDYSDNEPKSCICSTFAERLNATGGCCCRRIVQNNQEVSCDLINESELDILDDDGFADAVTQNSDYRLSLHGGKVCFNHTKSSISKEILDLNSKVTEILTVPSKKSTKTLLPQVSHFQECEMRIVNTETKLLISDEDKATTEATDKKMSKSTRHKHDKAYIGADILQLYETKKAVLEIYAEKTKNEDGEHIVAKLPKFVYGREDELYEKQNLREKRYSNVYRKNFVMMSVGR